jgi:hypothetical protein
LFSNLWLCQEEGKPLFSNLWLNSVKS